MRPLGEYLAGLGLTIIGARLAGHGTRPSDLWGKTCRHWIASAEDGLTELKSKCRKVFIVGLSMGGSIALHLAAQNQVDGVVAICAPVYLDFKLYLSRPLRFLLGFKDELGRNIKDPVARRNHLGYSSVPPGAVLQFLYLLGTVRKHLDRVTIPVLLIQARDDLIIPWRNAAYIYDRLVNCEKKRLVWLKNSGHVATIDYDKFMVFEETFNFISESLNFSH